MRRLIQERSSWRYSTDRGYKSFYIQGCNTGARRPTGSKEVIITCWYKNGHHTELKAPQLQKKENKCQEAAGYVIKANMYVLEK